MTLSLHAQPSIVATRCALGAIAPLLRGRGVYCSRSQQIQDQNQHYHEYHQYAPLRAVAQTCDGVGIDIRILQTIKKQQQRSDRHGKNINNISRVMSTAATAMTQPPNLQWTELHPKRDSNHENGAPCGRSSHGVSYIGGDNPRLIIYGGEHIARTPLDETESTWACDFNNVAVEGEEEETSSSLQWRAIAGGTAASFPPMRVGHAQAVHEESSTVYVFGGRSGIQMEEAAMNDLWKLDCSGPPGTESWSKVSYEDENNSIPEERSFHKMVCIGDSLYVFGGCGTTSGRMNDMHRFDIKESKWYNLGSSQYLKGRGGPTFLPYNSNQQLGVVAGFAGEETNDGHMFDIQTEQWVDDNNTLTEQLKGMRPRSVCIGGSFPDANVTIIFGGEVDPSEKGHEGAGGFENDIVLLDETTGNYITTIPFSATNTAPDTRGWSDGATKIDDTGGSLYVFGGLSGNDTAPKRLDDLWKLQVTKQ